MACKKDPSGSFYYSASTSIFSAGILGIFPLIDFTLPPASILCRAPKDCILLVSLRIERDDAGFSFRIGVCIIV